MGSKREDDNNAVAWMIDELDSIIPENSKHRLRLHFLQNKFNQNKYLNDSDIIILQKIYEKWTE